MQSHIDLKRTALLPPHSPLAGDILRWAEAELVAASRRRLRA